jgi:hypothetical protein
MRVWTLIVLGKVLEKIDQRKQAKLHWSQNPSQINGDNLQN